MIYASNFGGKKSRAKVMMGSNMPQNVLYGLVSMIIQVFFVTAI